jgi:adenosylmethionine-8-amino-7-oxononanoate aminotransferase
MSPLVVTRASGARLILDTGEELLDGISSWWCNIHGHGHPALIEAATQQFSTLDHVLFAGCTHEPAVLLAEQLLAILPGPLSKVFYSDNGSTAVEVALKLAVQFWYNRGEHRGIIIALQDSYHGDTFGAMAAGARGLFSKPFEEMLFGVERVSTKATASDLEHLEQLCQSGSVAAFIFEPCVQGAGGMVMYDHSVLDAYIAICRRYNVIVIADEVMTGFGRTGPLFASSLLAIKPDLICLSKALTNGSIPLAVTACSEDIFQAFVSNDYSRTFFHGHTFTANPIGCAIALASLSLTLAPECAESRLRIERAHLKCAEQLTLLPRARNVRVTGTILAFDYEDQGGHGYTSSVRDRALTFFRSRGILLRPLGNVVYCMPPYCVTDSDLATIHKAILDFAQESA